MPFVFLVLYVTFLLLRPQEWYEPLYGYEMVNVSAILTIFATFISQSTDQSAAKVLWRDKYAQLMWGLLLAVVLSQLAHGRIHGALDAASEFGKSCVLLFTTMILVDNPKRLRRMMWVIVISAAIFCIHGYMQVQTGHGFGNIAPFGSFYTGDFRIQGTGMFADPNDFATLYIVAIPFVFTFVQTKTQILAKFFVIAALPGMFYVIYYTQSRGAVIGLAAMMLAYIWFSTRTTMLRLLIAGPVLAAMIALGPVRARQSVYEGSAGGRVMQWGYGNQFLRENPLFGIGYSRWLEFSNQVAHNSFVTCYGELGLVGYACWFSLMWFVFRAMYKILKLPGLDRGMRGLGTGLFAALVGFYASSFFLTRTYNPFLYLLLGMAIGIIRYVQRQPYCPARYLAITPRDLGQSVLMSFASVPLIWGIVRLYWKIGGGA